MLPAALALILACSPQQPEASDLTRLSDLELARQLPLVHSEGAFDPAEGRYVLRPEVVEFRRRIEEGRPFEDEVWREALTRSGAIKVRPRWPVNEPLAVSVEWPAWLSAKELRFVPRPPLESIALRSISGCVNAIFHSRDSAFHRALGPLEPGVMTLEFRWEFWKRPEGWDLVRDRSGTLSFPVEVVASLDEVFPVAEDPDLVPAILASLTYGEGFLSIDPDAAVHPALATTGLSLAIDVLREGQLVETAHLLAARTDSFMQLNSRSHGRPRLYATASLPSLRALKAEPGDGWSLRVRGVTKDALKLWDAARLWRGEFTVPLGDLERR